MSAAGWCKWFGHHYVRLGWFGPYRCLHCGQKEPKDC